MLQTLAFSLVAELRKINAGQDSRRELACRYHGNRFNTPSTLCESLVCNTAISHCSTTLSLHAAIVRAISRRKCEFQHSALRIFDVRSVKRLPTIVWYRRSSTSTCQTVQDPRRGLPPLPIAGFGPPWRVFSNWT